MNKNPWGPLFGGEQVWAGRGAAHHPQTPGFSLWRPGDPVSVQKIRIGTSGYSFRDWIGPFYPPGTRPAEMLPFYASCFPAVELNVTYYRLPHANTFSRIENKTPKGFEFFVKLQSDLTHKRGYNPSAIEAFLEAIQPLRQAGKYIGALAQFPWSFRRTRENQKYLEWLGSRFPARPLVIEFRHDSWAGEETFQLLKNSDLDFCSVDEPDLRGLFPPMARRTAAIGYIRLHGRNKKDWWTGQGSERYNYLYSKDELQEWVDKIRELADQSEKTYVFFNNCHAGHAVQNAQYLAALLQGEGDFFNPI
ncbi:MAG: DUF72 domain-containing protein [Candidatus Eisenbacteria bacterium]|uniref:DUF72 domain-containing protein n=1 Tax=Eiseniibacteriota bacterium TaxID=2212470 RepID=A0A948W6D2_UNCEI|nr:DUF72 domain-containing protein [Candidatus Eisenbacteria bacterium]MBU1951270.1 DUF72 domain-containing protein [Candidatus Eisenbacteria bacterium]MBU2691000.1 DUF72 domain-containing protein [Candidatus Eisenbacteria bacterium]